MKLIVRIEEDGFGEPIDGEVFFAKEVPEDVNFGYYEAGGHDDNPVIRNSSYRYYLYEELTEEERDRLRI